jgi:hypothetical protein
LNKTILSKSGKLDIDVEDIAFMTGESKNCKEIKFELDFCSKKPIRIVTIEGSLGRILWDLNKRKLKLKFFGKDEKVYNFENDYEKKYRLQIKHFFDCINCDIKPRCTIRDGLMVLDLVNQAKKISRI